MILKRMTRRERSRGFTLVEMAVITLISGLLLSLFLAQYRNYIVTKDFRITVDQVSRTRDRLNQFFNNTGRYPCPADPTLPTTDPNYGLESCRVLLTDPCPVGLTCTNFQTRDTAIDADAANDFVTIGAIPARTLAEFDGNAPYSESDGIDAFGMKIGYAVTEEMTRAIYTLSNPANQQIGVVAVRDENNRSLVPAYVTGEDATAHYVVYSMGENKKGAYAPTGLQAVSCATIIVGIPTNGSNGNDIGTGLDPEVENCDNADGLFVSALQSRNDSNYFDDIIMFGTLSNVSLWQNVEGVVGNQKYIYNTNLGSVAVGNMIPSAALDVDGDIYAETRVISPLNYCDQAGPNPGPSIPSICVDPNFLGGTGVTCPPFQAAYAIENNTLLCKAIPMPTNFQCPNPGEFLAGFASDGTMDCRAP